jgi:FAD synthetase
LKVNSKEVESVVRYVRDYLSDSKFYLGEKKDITNSLISSSYAEGLLDAMRLLKIIEFSWKKNKEDS